MKPGVYDTISNAEYHGGAGVSKSFLDLVHRSPLHARYRQEAANDDHPPTPAQVIGSAFHALLLEPELFVKEYTLALRQADVPDAIADRDTLVSMVQELNAGRLPKLSTSGSKAELVARIVEAKDAAHERQFHDAIGYEPSRLESLSLAELKGLLSNLNTTRPGLLSDKGTIAELAAILRANGRPVTLWSDVKQTWLENNGHRTVLDADAWDQLHRMRDSVMAHPAARALLTAVPGKAEQSVYWVDDATGELCRCRPDFWRNDGILVDVKTTEDASPEEFARSIAKWRYHVQHPFYVDGVNAARKQARLNVAPARAFVFLVAEKKAPYAVAVYSLDVESVGLGRLEYQRDLATLHECKQSGTWPGYGDNIKAISLPGWHITKTVQALGLAA